MGSTFDNCHVRTMEADSVAQALRAMQQTAYLSEPQNGWVSVYFLGHDFEGENAQRLSAALKLPVLFLWEYDSDTGGYKLFENGTLRDEWVINPDWGSDELDENGDETPPKTPEEKARLAGNPDILLPYCLPETTREQIIAALGVSHAESLGRMPEDFQASFPHQMSASIERFQEALSGTRIAEQLADFSYDDFMQTGDPDAALPELAALLGLGDQWSLSDRDVRHAGFPLQLVGAEFLSDEQKDEALGRALDDASPFQGEFQEKALADVRAWLERGANPNGFRHSTIPYFFSAVAGGKTESARILLQYGADVNGRYLKNPGHPNDTFLIALVRLCAHNAEQSLSAVQFLLEFGADLTLRNLHRETALAVAQSLTEKDAAHAAAPQSRQDFAVTLAGATRIVQLLQDAGATE